MSTEGKKKKVCLNHGFKEVSCRSVLPEEQAVGGCRGTPMLCAYANTWQCSLGNKRLQIPHTQVKSYSGSSSYFGQNDGIRRSLSLKQHCMPFICRQIILSTNSATPVPNSSSLPWVKFQKFKTQCCLEFP